MKKSSKRKLLAGRYREREEYWGKEKGRVTTYRDLKTGKILFVKYHRRKKRRYNY